MNKDFKLELALSMYPSDEILEIQYLIDDEETKVVFTISPKK